MKHDPMGMGGRQGVGHSLTSAGPGAYFDACEFVHCMKTRDPPGLLDENTIATRIPRTYLLRRNSTRVPCLLSVKPAS